MAKLKESVVTKTEDDKDLTLDVRYPSGRQFEEANVLYSIHWRNATSKGLLTKKQLDQELREKGIWTEADDDKEKEIWKDIEVLGKQLKSGKKTGSTIPMTKWDGRELAIAMHNRRNDLREHLSVRNSYDNLTAEAFAENIRFNYLVSACTVYSTNGEPYYSGLEDYQNRTNEKASVDAARKLATMLYGGEGFDFSEDFEKNVIEIQFLKKFNYINDKGKFVDPKTKKFMNANGDIVNDSDNVDIFGNKIKDGKVLFEFGEFLDDDVKVDDPKLASV